MHPTDSLSTDCAFRARYDAVFTHPVKVSCEYDGGFEDVVPIRGIAIGESGPFAYGNLTFDGSFPNTEVLLVNKYDWDEIFLLRVRHGSGEVCGGSSANS